MILIGNPSSATLLGTFPTGDEPRAMTWDGSRLLIIRFNTSTETGSLWQLTNVSNPSTASSLGALASALDRVESCTWDGFRLLLSNRDSTTTSLWTINNPSSPSSASQLSSSNLNPVLKVWRGIVTIYYIITSTGGVNRLSDPKSNLGSATGLGSPTGIGDPVAGLAYVDFRTINMDPVVTATATPTTIPSGGVVTVGGTASDPDGDAITTLWDEPSNNDGMFADPTSIDTNWTAPNYNKSGPSIWTKTSCF